MPTNEKSPPPDGFTGVAGRYASKAEVNDWSKPRARFQTGKVSFPVGNVAIRLPRNVLGIDVDAYGEKTGGATLDAAEESWGQLPPTWVTTSKTDGVSGIRLFRIPEGLAWPGELPQGKGVELIRWDHRFAIVAPSIHDKTGDPYQWWREEDAEDGTREMVLQSEEFPSAEDLPELPRTWVDGLTSGKKWKERDVDETMDAREMQDWLAARVDPDTMCGVMRSTVRKWLQEVRKAGDDGGAHESARDAAWAVLGDAKMGHSGVAVALAELRASFLEAVRERRAGLRQAKGEWARAVGRGIAKVSAEGEPEGVDPCASNDRRKASGSSELTYRRDDVGNAARLISVMNNRARYSEALGGWMLWDGHRWSPDTTGQVERWAVKAVDEMDAELEFIEDPKEQAAFRSWQRTSGNLARLTAMEKVARGRKGIIIPSDQFDAQPRLLNTPTGTLLLAEDGVRSRGAPAPEDYLTLTTGVPYEPKATSALWEKFLDDVLPDEKDRLWVQTLIGYSMLGGNPERCLVLAKGPTTSGKTTFAEVVSASLGDYAKPYNLSLLKEKQEEGGRADVIAVLPRRLIVASEASHEWVLHADRIKLITGGERITARRLNSNDYISRVPAFTPWITTNSWPSIPGADRALWMRIKVAPFLVPLDPDAVDVTLRERLMRELPAVLAWCLRGWEAYCRDGLREVPPAALSMGLDARDEMNELGLFIREACDEGSPEEYRVSAADLFKAYQAWVDLNGDPRRSYSKIGFGRALSGRGYEPQRYYPDGSDKQVRGWFGIRLKAAWEKVV